MGRGPRTVELLQDRLAVDARPLGHFDRDLLRLEVRFHFIDAVDFGQDARDGSRAAATSARKANLSA